MRKNAILVLKSGFQDYEMKFQMALQMYNLKEKTEVTT